MKRMVYHSRKSGYALVLAILIIGVITTLIASVVNKVIVFGRLGNVLVEREQARILAMSGLQIAIAQLSDDPQAVQSQAKSGADKQPSELGRTLKKVMPLINRWQMFTCTEEKEGVDGSCELYIACEHGKISINRLYDFENKKFIKNDKLDGYKVLQIASEKVPQGKELAEGIAAMFKERGRPLQDVTEIFKDKKFKKLAAYVFPSSGQAVTLLDLFTVETTKPFVQPWFLSKSLNTVLGFKNQDTVEKAALDTLFEKGKSLPNTTAWQQNWDTYLAPIYGKQYSTIVPEIRALFNEEFEIPNFSVISYGKFGKVVVKAYAVLQKKEDKTVSYCVKKIYWI